MSDDSGGPIGGYFELELPARGPLPYPGALRFQSARAAFLALLRAGKPRRVWMPRYICDAMVAPLADAGVETAWYDVGRDFEVDESVELGADDWLLYVNYFGVCDKNVAGVLRRFSCDQVVLDYSQAFFSTPVDEALATIYSARKFFGVPDGGLLATRLAVSAPEQQDTASLNRSAHLLLRLGESPEAGYAAYREAEESLASCEPLRMSKLTQTILSTIDFDGARRKRRENFLFLQENLGKMNRLSLDTVECFSPMCYPFLTSVDELRSRLIERQIFVATYWTEALDRLKGDWSGGEAARLLPLPIDQRYGRIDMERIVSVIRGASQ